MAFIIVGDSWTDTGRLFANILALSDIILSVLFINVFRPLNLITNTYCLCEPIVSTSVKNQIHTTNLSRSNVKRCSVFTSNANVS